MIPAVVALLLAAAPGELARYEATLLPDGERLEVVARLPPGCDDHLSADPDYARWVEAVEVQDGAAWKPAARAGKGYLAPGCAERGCAVRYRYLLGKAADKRDDYEEAWRHEGALFLTPAGFLLTPEEWPHEARYRLKVSAPPGWSFVTGLPRASDGSGDYEGELGQLSSGMGPFSGFGHFRTATVQVGGAELAVAATGDVDIAELERWARRSGEAVAGYYGRFPVPRAAIFVNGGRKSPWGGWGSGVGFGAAMGQGGSSVMIWVGAGTSRAEFDDDWTLAHEMVHLALPRVGRDKHAWLSEGLATYVEPVARARAGTLSEQRVWSNLVENLPKGQPGLFDKGLDNTHSWGRTYWGGALFCLLAEVEIRERTQNRFGLRDAMKAVVEAGGNDQVAWDIERVFAEGDKATGTTALADLYARHKDAAVTADLDALWKKLGVVRTREGVRFDDAAPGAALRKAITAPPRGDAAQTRGDASQSRGDAAQPAR